MSQNQIPQSDSSSYDPPVQPGHSVPNQALHHSSSTAEPVRFSAMAIAALVLGVVALATSFLPILNNVSFFIALLGAIFAIVGIIAGCRRTRRGRGLAIAALVVSVAACAAVLWTQSIYSQAIDAVTSGDQVVGSSQAASSSKGAGDVDEDQVDYFNMIVGDVAELESGLKVAVTGVGTQQNYDGSMLVVATVTYENAGTENAFYNPLDWESQNANGAQTSCTYYSGDNTLSSGTLIPGGSVSGDVYFQGDAVKLLYSSSLIADATAAWNIA